MNVYVKFILVALALVCLVEGKVHRHDFVLKEKNFTRLCSTKSAMVVNESIPGPVLYVNKGDILYVNVYNQGNSKVTLHWHGVKNPRNPWYDGPEYITQCAIKPGTNFTYEVIFSDEEGTVWWHAHNEWTRNTVHGAIVVYPEEGTSYPFPEPDGEEILVLASWFTFDVNLVVEQALEYDGLMPDSDAYTINSQPGDLISCGKGSAYTWQVEHGKTYLLRLVNAAMSSQFFFAIAEHNITVVGVDGAYVKPFVSSYLVIAPGNTMDVLITTNQTLGHYYIAIRKYTLQDPVVPTLRFDETTATAILEYKGNYTPPISPSFPTDTLPTYSNVKAALHFYNRLRSLYDQIVPTNITTQMFITVATNELTFNITDTLAASLNNISWQNPKIDVLQAYYNNISGYYGENFPDMPPAFFDFVAEELPFDNWNSKLATEVKMLEYGEEVEIVFQTVNILNSSQDHPMHLHGHSFYVVGSGPGDFDFEVGPKTYNLVDPAYMNTATLPQSGWLAVRFFALNPGVWLWHCHLDNHLSYGMLTALIVKNGGTTETSIRKPPAYMPPCEGVDPPLIKLWKS
ncbi:laccase 14 [Euphorbia peplus]|nr:laccase 14 [Euphorbia peplus]